MKSTWKKTCLLGLPLVLVSGVLVMLAQNGNTTYNPKRINRAVELLADHQPIYYTGSHTGAPGGAGGAEASFEQGKKDAQTFADYISYDMEHTAYDIVGLTAYMKGLVAGGPTKSGHRTPAVIVNCPVNGLDEASVRANAWMFQQVLAAGVHGIMLTHADNPGAIRAFIEAVRFPIHKEGVGPLLHEGHRGQHGSAPAAQIWGISLQEYEDKADPWPLNPNGELLLGVKEEDKYALANVEENLKVPGIGMAEWGPGDMALSLGVRSTGRGAAKGGGGGSVSDPRMQAARAKVLAACKANHVAFLNSMSSADVVDMIKEGVMVGPASQATAEIGRKFTNRQMPW
jgi:4-hydroxy-2-oxoheptanedioate aldolase